MAIPLTIGSLQTGVTLSMVPLVGLGSDQVNNSRNSSNLIEAYHLDKNRGVDGYALRRRLLSLLPREANRVSIFLYASPHREFVDYRPTPNNSEVRINKLARCNSEQTTRRRL